MQLHVLYDRIQNLGAPNLTPDDIEVSLDCAHIIPHFLGEESTVEHDVEFLIIELIFRNLIREPLGLCSIIQREISSYTAAWRKY